MAEGLLGRKRGMTQIFNDRGQIIPVTVLEVGPCFVTQIKTSERDGYTAIQLGFEETQRTTKALRGHLKKLPPVRHIREVRTSDIDKYQVGQKLNAALFATGELVDVSGISKGKGTAGVVKRHHFRGGPKTHGQSDRPRAQGHPSRRTNGQRARNGPESRSRVGRSRAQPGRRQGRGARREERIGLCEEGAQAGEIANRVTRMAYRRVRLRRYAIRDSQYGVHDASSFV
jgi:large subunit ribosomal protein L3